MAKVSFFLSLLTVFFTSQVCLAQVKEMDRLPYKTPDKIHYSMGGVVGERVQVNLDNWLLPAPVANPGILEMFRLRDREPVPQLVPWAGEFIGKYLISGIQARRMVNDPRLEELLKSVIAEFISTQAEDGYLGPFRQQERLLGNWDLWGHYHAITALLMWYEDTGDKAALDCAIRAGDLVCKTFLDTGKRPLSAGSDEMNLSILTAMGRLHRHTGEERYFQMMKMVEEDWEQAGDYFRQGLKGVDFYRIPRPRWESLHDLQGLVELYQITGNEDYATSFMNLWRSIAHFDRHNTGGFSTGEQAVGNPYTSGAIETCCTTAWAALCNDMAHLMGRLESTAGDELELSLFNSILGSQHPSGRWWTYNTPMDGKREASAHTIVFQSRAGTPELNCCSVNAPRGIGAISEWGILTDGSGKSFTINYFGPMEAEFDLSEELHVKVKQETNYPADGHIKITVELSNPALFESVGIRIPAWSKETRVKATDGNEIGKDLIDACKGRYLFTAKPDWKAVETIEVDFDMSLRTLIGDGACAGKISLYHGPVLLAFDQRDNPYDCNAIPALDYAHLEAEPVEVGGKFPPMVAFKFKGVDGRPVILRDFASAGSAGTEYVSWLPVVNAPPPDFSLLEPANKAVVPQGPKKFTWTGLSGEGSNEYVLEISRRSCMTDVIYRSEVTRKNWIIVRENFEPDTAYWWHVVATNKYGSHPNEGPPSSFTIDKALENTFIDHPALMEYRADGLVAASHLDGDGSTIYGYMEHAQNMKGAADRNGKENGAVAFAGDGMLRYLVPSFPTKNYTFVAWFCADQLPKGQFMQVFSAWARSGDDPLRVCIDKGLIFARIEGGGGAGTDGVEISAGKWTHVAVVKQGGKLYLYVDGRLAHETGCPGDLPTTSALDFSLGANPHYSGNEYFQGRIDDFALFAKALNAEEIEKIYREGLKLE